MIYKKKTTAHVELWTVQGTGPVVKKKKNLELWSGPWTAPLIKTKTTNLELWTCRGQVL